MLHFQEIPLINLPSWEVIPLLPRSKVTRMEFYVEKHGGPKKNTIDTTPKANIFPEQWCLENYVPFEMVTVQGTR